MTARTSLRFVRSVTAVQDLADLRGLRNNRERFGLRSLEEAAPKRRGLAFYWSLWLKMKEAGDWSNGDFEEGNSIGVGLKPLKLGPGDAIVGDKESV